VEVGVVPRFKYLMSSRFRQKIRRDALLPNKFYSWRFIGRSAGVDDIGSALIIHWPVAPRTLVELGDKKKKV
jgi:hypothetical protein